MLLAFGVLLALAALVFVGGGAYLIWPGGSPCFLLIGWALLASGLLRVLSTPLDRSYVRRAFRVGAQATPMTYRSSRTGREYVFISAGGSRTSPNRGDYVIAYALPAT